MLANKESFYSYIIRGDRIYLEDILLLSYYIEDCWVFNFSCLLELFYIEGLKDSGGCGYFLLA